MKIQIQNQVIPTDAIVHVSFEQIDGDDMISNFTIHLLGGTNLKFVANWKIEGYSEAIKKLNEEYNVETYLEQGKNSEYDAKLKAIIAKRDEMQQQNRRSVNDAYYHLMELWQPESRFTTLMGNNQSMIIMDVK